jgi:PhzF family phenazine biosynthesis protein
MEIQRLSAFTLDGRGGNPAGVVLSARGLSSEDMLRVAQEVGFSETAFLDLTSDRDATVRYFSPVAEVPFCGHATIAAAVALAEATAPGDVVFRTMAGDVLVSTTRDAASRVVATLTSVTPEVRQLPDRFLDAVLPELGWTPEQLDPQLPPAFSYAGAWHLILAVRDLATLENLDYDFDGVLELMTEHSLTTLQLCWRETEFRFRSRNPFPVGGVREDPATGAAAAALGAYLRERGLVSVPARIQIIQGVEMGRPSLIEVDIPSGRSGISVRGTATRMEEHTA